MKIGCSASIYPSFSINSFKTMALIGVTHNRNVALQVERICKDFISQELGR